MTRLARKTKATSTRGRRSPSSKLRKKKWGWGGARPGAGRPKSPDSGVPHTARPTIDGKHPVQVTLRVRDGVPDFRRGSVYRAVAAALEAGADRFGFRLLHYAIKSGEVNLIAEARDREALSRGVQGLSVRLARRANAAADRSGKVFGDRYEVRVLKSPAETKQAVSGMDERGAVASSVATPGRGGRGRGGRNTSRSASGGSGSGQRRGSSRAGRQRR
jgi:hypothetical protein